MKLEKEGLVVTPLTEQKTGLWDMAFIWFCANVAVPRLMIGGSLAGLGFGKLILILLAGNILVFLFYYAGIHSTMSGVVMAFLVPMTPRFNEAYFHRSVCQSSFSLPAAARYAYSFPASSPVRVAV